MADFEIAFKKTLHFEGVYSNHRLDRGGKTKYGITEKVARHCQYVGKMKELPLQVAKNIYETEYWDKLSLDIFPQDIADELFDTAVNCGIRIAGKFLQKSINILCNTKLKVDGIIGTNTIRYIINNRANINEKQLLKCLNGFQFMRYINIIKFRTSQKIFFKGWLKRV